MGYNIIEFVLRVATTDGDVSDWDFNSLLKGAGEGEGAAAAILVEEYTVDYKYAEEVDTDDISSRYYDKHFVNKEDVDHDSCHEDCHENCTEDYHYYLDCPANEQKPNTLGDWLSHAEWCIIKSASSCGCGLNAALMNSNIEGLMSNG